MKRVLFIAYHFPPLASGGTQRSLKYVKYLPDFGWQPEVVSVADAKTAFHDQAGLLEVPASIRVVRIKDPRESLLQRIGRRFFPQFFERVFQSNQLDSQEAWSEKLLKVLKPKLPQSDLIFVSAAPFSTFLSVLKLTQGQDIPLVFDFRDEWANHPFLKDQRSKQEQDQIEAFERKCIEGASKVISVSEGIRQKFLERYPNKPEAFFQALYNGYDEADFKDKAIAQSREREKLFFCLRFIGMLYAYVCPRTCWQALAQLKQEFQAEGKTFNIRFEHIGALSEEYQALRLQLGLEKEVCLLGYQSHQDALRALRSADMAGVFLDDNPEALRVPGGKIFEYLRSGVPILAVVPLGGEIAELVQEFDAGYVVEPGDIKGCAEAIRACYQEWEKGSREASELGKKRVEAGLKRFERKALCSQLARTFDVLLEAKQG